MTTVHVHGTLPAIPTLLKDDRSVDEAALERILDRVFGAGVDGVVALGTSGEGMALDADRRREVLRAVKGRRHDGTMIAGCGGTSLRAVLEAVEDAAEEDFDAALVPAPYYYPTSDAALLSFYVELVERAALPIILYHIPARTTNRLSVPVVRELSELDGVIGIKDSDGQVTFHLELLDIQHDGFVVLQGLGPLVGWSYLHGAKGAVTPVSALFPSAELGIREAIERGDLSDLRRHEGRMNAVAQLFRSGGLPLVTNLKALAEVLDLGHRWTEPPTPTADSTHVAGLADALQRLGWPLRPA